jgi:hypothetical protein
MVLGYVAYFVPLTYARLVLLGSSIARTTCADTHWSGASGDQRPCDASSPLASSQLRGIIYFSSSAGTIPPDDCVRTRSRAACSYSYAGEALFDDSYADVVRDHWGVSSQLLAWAIVGMVWAHQTPAYYQILGVFGAMSASFVCWIPPRRLERKLPTRYLLAAVAGFLSIFMLPLAGSALSFGFWLKLLHLALLVPKFMWDQHEVDSTSAFLLLAVLSIGLHFSVPSSAWPQTACQISIT